MCGARDLWEFSVSFSQFCYETKTPLKQVNAIKKKKKNVNTIGPIKQIVTIFNIK